MEENKTLQQALCEVSAECGYVPKLGWNAAQSYEFVRAEDLLAVVRNGLAKRGVSVVETSMNLVSDELRPNPKGGADKHYVTLHMRATLKKGDDIAQFEGMGEGVDSGDKAVAKATTMAAKYMWAEAFLISFGDDPEADIRTDQDAAPAAKEGKAPKEEKKSVTTKAKPKTDNGNVEGLLARIKLSKSKSENDALRDECMAYRDNPEVFEQLKAAVIAQRAAVE